MRGKNFSDHRDKCDSCEKKSWPLKRVEITPRVVKFFCLHCYRELERSNFGWGGFKSYR